MTSSAGEQKMMDLVLAFFQADGWQYQPVTGKPVVRVGYRGERGTWVCYARVDETRRRVIFHTLLGMDISGEYRAAVGEYLMRANLEVPVGNFEMDMDTGQVRFKASLETPEGELSVAMVRSLAYAGLHAMDHYFPGVLSVVHGGLSPESALKRIATQAFEPG